MLPFLLDVKKCMDFKDTLLIELLGLYMLVDSGDKQHIINLWEREWGWRAFCALFVCRLSI